jgi:hypothetical protein
MTLAERLKNFQDRGFRAETAAVLVLIEEALHSLFASFRDTFVLSVERLSSFFMEVRGIPETSISCPTVMTPRKLRGSLIPYRPRSAKWHRP